jgi:DNA mismatch endonuclease (patch repair protein)
MTRGGAKTISLGAGLRVPYPTPSSRAATNVGIGNRRVDTKPEVNLRSMLHRRGHRFRKNYQVVAQGLRTSADVVFPRRRVAVFVDGCFWHCCPQHGTSPKTNSRYWKAKLERNVSRDRTIDAALSMDDWHVIRVWEHEPIDQAVAKIETALQHALNPNRRGLEGRTLPEPPGSRLAEF